MNGPYIGLVFGEGGIQGTDSFRLVVPEYFFLIVFACCAGKQC